VSELKPGMPWTPDVRITPLPEDGKTAWLSDLISDAVACGAQVVNEGGGQVNESFMFPALLYPVSKAAKIFREEQFGPVIPVVPFDNLQEFIDYVETSPYGQQASIFSTDPGVVARLIDPLVNQVSRVNLNSQCQRGPDVFPFTGRKDSAECTLSVSDALRVFSIRTLVAAKVGDVNSALLNDIVRQRRSNFLSTDFIF
jgi:acyl-CoA reductase-like NAD-dependent aldehyde dehydrogenase